MLFKKIPHPDIFYVASGIVLFICSSILISHFGEISSKVSDFHTMADGITKDGTIIIGKENTLTQSFIKCMSIRVQILPEDFENFGKYMFENISKTIANSQGSLRGARYILKLNNEGEIVLISTSEKLKPLFRDDKPFTKERV